MAGHVHGWGLQLLGFYGVTGLHDTLAICGGELASS